MTATALALPLPGGFPTGIQVSVTGGRYADQHGVVVDRQPDLRPGSVWVDLTRTGIHLVPGYRLVARPTGHT